MNEPVTHKIEYVAKSFAIAINKDCFLVVFFTHVSDDILANIVSGKDFNRDSLTIYTLPPTLKVIGDVIYLLNLIEKLD
jgi:hypothetical protein